MIDHEPVDLADLAHARALNDHLIVRRYPPEKVTAGGIVLPDVAKEKKAVAWVLKAPEGCTQYAEGDTVVMPNHAVEPLNEVAPRDEDVMYVKISDIVLHYPRRKESGATEEAAE